MPEGVLNQNDRSIREIVMDEAKAVAGDPPSPKLRSLVCPYCGTITPDSGRCTSCSGRFDPLSRQATQNQMGPWSIRDDRDPHRPGCSFGTIKRLVEQGKISQETILRGPTTRQFWMLAKHTPGVAHLLGVCHSCQIAVKPDGFACPNCHASFNAERDRQHLGLGPTRPLPGQGMPEVLAIHAEPASQPGLARAASTPVGPIGIGEAGLAGSGVKPQLDLLEAQKAVEESTRRAKRWRRAYESQRRQAWIVLTIAAMITLVALAYIVWESQSIENPQSANRNSPNVVSEDG